MTARDIRTWTRRDQQLSKVLTYALEGWPNRVDTTLAPYSNRRTEISTENGCLLWGNRVIVPPQGREAVIRELHETHPGITRMKAIARSYVWWPRMDSAIEEAVKSCTECQQNASATPSAPLHPWDWPESPWSRLHIDYAGPVEGRMLLIVVEAHSKWLEVKVTKSAVSPVLERVGRKSSKNSERGSNQDERWKYSYKAVPYSSRLPNHTSHFNGHSSGGDAPGSPAKNKIPSNKPQWRHKNPHVGKAMVTEVAS